MAYNALQENPIEYSNAIGGLFFIGISIFQICILLYSNQSYYYKERIDFKFLLGKRRTSYYSEIDSYNLYKKKGRYGEVEIIEIYINHKLYTYSEIQNVKIHRLTEHLRRLIPSKEKFDGLERYNTRTNRIINYVYFIWISLWLSFTIWRIVSDKGAVDLTLIIVLLCFTFGIPALAYAMNMIKKEEDKGFEPLKLLLVYTLSRRASSTTRAILLIWICKCKFLNVSKSITQ